MPTTERSAGVRSHPRYTLTEYLSLFDVPNVQKSVMGPYEQNKAQLPFRSYLAELATPGSSFRNIALGTEPNVENCGSPTVRFGEVLDFFLSFRLRTGSS